LWLNACEICKNELRKTPSVAFDLFVKRQFASSHLCLLFGQASRIADDTATPVTPFIMSVDSHPDI